MEPNNIDSVLVKAMQPQPATPAPQPPELTKPPEALKEATKDVIDNPAPEPVADIPQEEPVSNVAQEPEKTDNKPATDGSIDEYGNPVEKPRMYTEEELQQRIRDRLSRGRHAEQAPPTQREVQQRAEDFKVDPNSEESWETQLEAFVEKTIDKRQQKISEQQWRQQEAEKQSQFEEKFSTGMTKYQDFNSVVKGKPITDHMMMAARNLDNPAAFIYGAAKMHPQELERISRIPDGYAQAAEIGKLHEKMVKGRASITNTPKPLEAPRGDIAPNVVRQPSLEERIAQHAASKRK